MPPRGRTTPPSTHSKRTIRRAVSTALDLVTIGRVSVDIFHDTSVSPFGYSFQLDVTPGLGLIGIGWALAMGLIGGVLPAVRAGRVPVTAALRAA
jgi:ABC-type antimicrobial peptide transport system permease subunit